VDRPGGERDATLQQEPADLVDQRGTMLYQSVAHAMHGLDIELLVCLDLRETHVLLGHGSDFTFIPGVAPRFGENACWIYKEALNPTKERQLNASQYDKANQKKGIVYTEDDAKPKCKVNADTNQAPLDPYHMDERTYDFNCDGLANYGLVPDLLQDLRNLGMTTEAFQSLFSSAEDYIQTWEKALKISGCDGTKPECQFKEVHGACKDFAQR
jgi:hypothetical protein